MSRLLCAFLAAVLLFGVTLTANAAPEKKKPDPAEQFKKLDANSDGKVSEAEFVGKKTGEKADKAKAAFAKKDKNGDGSLTMEEFAPKKKKDA